MSNIFSVIAIDPKEFRLAVTKAAELDPVGLVRRLVEEGPYDEDAYGDIWASLHEAIGFVWVRTLASDPVAYVRDEVARVLVGLVETRGERLIDVSWSGVFQDFLEDDLAPMVLDEDLTEKLLQRGLCGAVSEDPFPAVGWLSPEEAAARAAAHARITALGRTSFCDEDEAVRDIVRAFADAAASNRHAVCIYD